MKSLLRRLSPLARELASDRGGVIMEYVLLTVLIVGPLVGVSGLIFNPGRTTFDMEGAVTGQDFGFLGNSFVSMYRMVMAGISLPLP